VTFKEVANRIMELCMEPEITFTCPYCSTETETRTDVDRAACDMCESVFESEAIIIYKILEMRE